MADNNGNEVDFGALFEKHMETLRTELDVGDKVEGVVTAIDRRSVFMDINARSDGIVDRTEFVDEEGQLSVSVGDRLEVFCVGADGDEIRLTTRMTGAAADASLWDAYENGIPVEGRVKGERKGGFEVTVANHKAFCPYSQMDVHKQDAEAYIGEKFAFVISEYDERGKNLVLSRRALLERERAAERERLEESLQPGDMIDGRVARIMPFGVFVDLGGVDGLIPMRDLSWGRNVKAEDILSEGENVTVMVQEIDWDEGRISLSLKHAQGDPWTTLEESSKYIAGSRHTGTVTNLMPFGAFVELEPGIEGLVHVSRLGAGRPVSHPEEVVSEGETVEVSIENVDVERRRISLSMDDTIGGGIDGEGDEESGPVIAEGKTVSGVVDAVKDFGVFVRLPQGRNGLLHISEVELRGSSNRRRALFDMFPPESEVEVVIKEIKGDRISLTLQETLDKEAQQLDAKDLKDSGSDALGSLGDVFGDLKI